MKKQKKHISKVAPYTGAWIEIMVTAEYLKAHYVAPYTGAWIEIIQNLGTRWTAASLPTRERGLKSLFPAKPAVPFAVAPYTGAWIEMADGSVGVG